jgi:hypothetical protein
MSSDLYREIIENYRPLTRDNEEKATPKRQIKRAYEILEKFSDPDFETNPILKEAVRLVEEEGFVRPRGKRLTKSYKMRYANGEMNALMEVAAFVVAEIEEENGGKELSEENLVLAMIKAMQELCVGKNAIMVKKYELDAGNSGRS